MSALQQRFRVRLNNPKTMIYELAIIGGVVLVYQFIQFVIHQNKQPKQPKDRDNAIAIKIGDYLPKSYNPPMKTLPIPDDVKQAIKKPIMSKLLLYPISEAPLRLSQSDPSKDFPFGWGWDDKNILHIHCNTIFPNATPDMIKFWFINHGNGRGKYHWYKWWHPIDHIRAWWSDNQIHPSYDKKNGYIGHTSFVYEYLCKDIDPEMQYLRIHFVDPKEFGFTDSMLNEKEKREIVCARAGFMKFQVESSQFIHYFEKYGDNGCIMKSRFWVGNATIDDTIPIPLRWIITLLFSFPFMRKVLIPNDIGSRILIHCAKEMNNLATFLPQLYSMYHDK